MLGLSRWSLLGLVINRPQLPLGVPVYKEDSEEGKYSAGTYHQCSVELWDAS